ncbi:hypothetical protein [Clostridium estertheticum]|uniref:hypothetical protein n=1 Tax=Clostridium estertheticum TaxID=238834 RepID=UPI001C0D5798|nr:hypothetical protein [Clostridium estertheticum]MBU3173338.1 hypothetical protein [Clostridium estertheticum]
MKDINIKDIKIHECEELKQTNKLISNSIGFNRAEDAEVDIFSHGNEWTIGVPYMNNEEEIIEKAYSIVNYCAYCGKKL